jgi:hypothetical protein
METKKILIVKLLGVGRQNGNLVGTLLTSKVLQSAFSRQKQPRPDRVPHFFYADEFQNFQTPDFEDILAEAGGFKLALTLANQGFYQLDSKIKQAVFTNVTAARIAFCLNHEDVSNWKHYLPSDKESPGYFSPDYLAKLPPYTAFFAITGLRPVICSTLEPLPPPNQIQKDNAATIRAKTHEIYDPPAATFAENSPIRTVDKTAGNTTETVLELEQDASTDGNAETPTNLLSNPAKKAGPRKPR